MSQNFKRRQFITSAAISSIGLLFLNPVTSFANVIEQLNVFQKIGLLFYIDSKGKKRQVTTLAEWEIKRKQIIDGMQQTMGKRPEFSNLPGMNISIIDELKEENYTRLNISFTVAQNETVSAYLYVPFQKGIPKKFPDFKTDRYHSGTMKAIFDNMRCVDLLQARQDVDPNRIGGVIGHSLGGHNAIFTGAFDKRLKVIVSSCGWTLMDYYNAGKVVTEKYGGSLCPWAQERYMPLLREKYHFDVKKIPFDFDEVIAAIAPRAFFSNSPLNDSNFGVAGVKKDIAEVSELYRFLEAKDKLEVCYSKSQHDFAPEVRFEVFGFIDKILKLNS